MTLQKDIDTIIRGAVSEVLGAINSNMLGATVAPAPRARTAKPKSADKKPAAAKKTAKKAAKSKGASKPKRSPEALAALKDSLLKQINETPGQGIEQIAKALGASTKELNLPMKQLIADKKVSTQGEKRATKYFPRKGAAATTAQPPAPVAQA